MLVYQRVWFGVALVFGQTYRFYLHVPHADTLKPASGELGYFFGAKSRIVACAYQLATQHELSAATAKFVCRWHVQTI
jgi:hypothetical protein